MAYILVVEDDDAIQKMVASVLRHAGHEVTVASDGAEALTAVESRAPDLVVSDIMMPQVDGWQLVKRLRSQRSTAFTPVLFLSQLDGYDDRVRGYRLGADDYITKPFAPRDLQVRVQRMLDVDAIFEDTAGFSQGGSDLQGDLQRIGVSGVLMLLEGERKTGVLTLSQSGRVCRMWVRAGRVVRAEVPGEAATIGADAVYEGVSWSFGSFDFIECEVEGDDEIGIETTYLLIEGARRIDEASKQQP